LFQKTKMSLVVENDMIQHPDAESLAGGLQLPPNRMVTHPLSRSFAALRKARFLAVAHGKNVDDILLNAVAENIAGAPEGYD